MKHFPHITLPQPPPPTLHTITQSVCKSVSVVVLLITAFTVLWMPSMVHADAPTLQVIKVLTTDATGKSVPADDLRLGDKIRIVVRVSVTSNGPPRIRLFQDRSEPSLIVKVNDVAVAAGVFSVVSPVLNFPAPGDPFIHQVLVDYPGLPSADKDTNTNTGDLVFGKTIQSTDDIQSITHDTTLGGQPALRISGYAQILDAGNVAPTNDKVSFASGIQNALGAIRANGSLVRSPPPSTEPPPPPSTEPPPPEPKRRRIIQDCPVGWIRSDGFAGRTRRVLIYEVNVEMDMRNRVSIYKPVWVAIYVHPDEGLENLDGWKLQVALPYNRHREYPLTAENSVVVDAGFVEGGFAFIANPEEDPFPMTGIGFTGSPAPGFDYRLYDDQGKKVDFGISCYKRFDVFQVLKDMEDPRVLRKVSLKDVDWNASWFIRSEWTVPTPVNAPGAPSLQGVNLVGTWADLKKQ